MLRRFITLLVVVAIAGAAAWALWPQPIPVETEAVAKRDIEIFVEEEGKSRIREVFTVSAPISGKMLRVNLHAGDAVIEYDTIIASIKPPDPALLDARSRQVAEAAVEAARAAVDLAAAEVRQAEAQLAFMQSELDRATELARRGTISERAYEKAKLDVETAAASVESAKAALMVKKRELESARAALTEGTGSTGGACCVDVRAPVSGRVLRVLTESEKVVQAGMPLVEIGNPADLEIVADLLSRDAVRIRPGADATIENWGGPPLAAKVSRIDPSATTKVSALGIEEQRVPVILNLEGDPSQWAELGHDFRVVVRISLWKGSNVLAIPVGALFRRGADWVVYVIEDGKAKIETVELGQRNADYAQVTGGLSEGAVVILHPSDQVADGVSVAATLAD